MLVVINGGAAPATGVFDVSAYVRKPTACAIAKGTAPALDPAGATAWKVDLPARGYLVCEL